MAASASGAVPSAATALEINEALLWDGGRMSDAARIGRRADHRAHVDQLGEEAVLQRAPQEAHAARSSRSRLVANDALDGLQVPEAPELKPFFDIDELLGHLI